ncbi:MAG: hypothetical protein Q9219_004139 [cf. Caloplaca sp. 3 TL-2023]
MRSSRLPASLSAPSKDVSSVQDEATLEKPATSTVPEWQEPPLRPPAPSFEDYKGLERTGVLEYMQPLGTLPNARVRLRLKAYDPPKRIKHAKNGGRVTRAGTEDMSTPDPAPPPPPSRRSRSRKVDEDASRPSSSRAKNEDPDYKPNGLSVTTPSKAMSSHSSQHGTPSSRVSIANKKLMEVVESAVLKANEMGDPSLGLSLRKLFKESIENMALTDLLHAVLEQKPTPQQSAEFQSYMKRARKEVKAELKSSKTMDQMQRPSSEIQSASPSHNIRIGASLAKGTGDGSGVSKNAEVMHLTGHPHSPTKSNGTNVKSFSSDVSSLNQQAAPHRAKRSSSTSSLSSVASSLSSVDPNLALKTEEDFTASTLPPSPSTATMKGGRSKASSGPKMGTFSMSSKRSFGALQPSKEDEEFEAKKRKLTKTFPDYVVKDSDVRTRIAPAPIDDKARRASSIPALQHPNQQVSRLRNGIERSGAADDSEDLESPTTSVHSELLVPPPPFAGASRRGVTPTNLGRPPKVGKKSARVKMS